MTVFLRVFSVSEKNGVGSMESLILFSMSRHAALVSARPFTEPSSAMPKTMLPDA